MLLFVVDAQTRAISSMVEIALLIGNKIINQLIKLLNMWVCHCMHVHVKCSRLFQQVLIS